MLNPYILQNICPTRSWYRSKNEIFIAADTVQICNSNYFNAIFSDNLNNHHKKSHRLSDEATEALANAGAFACLFIPCILFYGCKPSYIEMQKMRRKMFMTSRDRRNENELNEMTYISHTRNWYQSRV